MATRHEAIVQVRGATGLAILGWRWAPEILLMLGDASTDGFRFNHLLATITGISDRILTERLRDLEDAGLVKRKVEAVQGVKVFYALTEIALPYLAPLRELKEISG